MLREESASVIDHNVLKWVNQPEDPNIPLCHHGSCSAGNLARRQRESLEDKSGSTRFHEADAGADKDAPVAALESGGRKRRQE